MFALESICLCTYILHLSPSHNSLRRPLNKCDSKELYDCIGSPGFEPRSGHKINAWPFLFPIRAPCAFPMCPLWTDLFRILSGPPKIILVSQAALSAYDWPPPRRLVGTGILDEVRMIDKRWRGI